MHHLTLPKALAQDDHVPTPHHGRTDHLNCQTTTARRCIQRHRTFSVLIPHASRLGGSPAAGNAGYVQLARTFEVTADYLLDDEQGDMTPVTVADRSLAERVRLIAALDPEERDALLKIIDALLTKKKVVDLVTGQMAALPTG